ncbi:MAG: phage tail tape measure protein [Candidatus Anammoxibacter sp.]
MAGNTIKGSEGVRQLSELYMNLAKSIDVATKDTKEFLTTTQKLPSEYIKALEKLKETQNAYDKALSQVTGKQKQFTANQKESARLANENIKVRAKIIQATSKEGKELQKLRLELTKVNRQQKLSNEVSSKLTGEYRRQSIILNRLRERFKNVALKQGESSKAAQNLLRKITKLDLRLKAVDKSAGQFGRVVGNYPRQLGGAARSIRNLMAAFGLTSAIFIFVQALRGAVKVFKDFDQAQADLAAILGRNRTEISALTEQAKFLGATTAFTATQVSNLQLELAKLGFDDKAILEATRGIENLAIATGVEAARAAKLGGSALRGFGLEASFANEVAATLAISTTKSALTFEKLETALPKVAAIAKSFGFTLADTTALLGGLANAGFEASIAGTSLRQIFLQLADSNGKLATRLGGGAENFDQLITQFQKLENEGISLGEAFNLTNARSVAAFKVFLAGAKDLTILRDSIIDVEDELDTLAEQKLDSIQGRLTLLNSAWQGWIINLDSSGEATRKIKDAIEFLTNNLDRILSRIIKIGKAFLVYKVIVLGTAIALRVVSAATVVFNIAQVFMIGGLKKARVAFAALNLTMKANPVLLVASAIAGLVAIFIAFKNGAEEAAIAQRELNEELAEGRRQRKELLKEDIEAQLEAINKRLSEVDEQGKTEENATNKKIDLIGDEIEKRELLNDTIRAQVKGRSSNVSQLQAEALEVVKSTVSIKNFGKALRDLKIDSDAALKDRKPVIPAAEITQNEGVVEALKKQRLELIKSLGLLDERESIKAAEKRRKLQQKIAELEIQQEIDAQKKIVDNDKENNLVRFDALNKRMLKEIELNDSKENFIINNKNSTNEEIRLAELNHENGLTDITDKGTKDRNKILGAVFADRMADFQKIQNRNKANLQEEEATLINSMRDRGASVEEIEKALTKFRREERRQQLQNEIDFAIKEVEVLAISAKQKALIYKALAKLRRELAQIGLDADSTDEQDELERLKRTEEAIREAFEGIGDAIGISGDNLATIFDGIQNGFESAGHAAEAFGQLATEAISAVITAQNERIDAQLDALQVEKETALRFAGDSAEAREQIEIQFDQRRRVLLRQKWDREKEAAIISSLINTAVAITKALPNIPLTIAVGIIGLAQTAIIASQNPPAFKEGVMNFKGGPAILGDGGVPEYAVLPNRKVIKTAAQETLYNLPRGTDVYKDEDQFVERLYAGLAFNGILPSVSNFKQSNQPATLTRTEFDTGISRLVKTINDSESSQIIFDERGYIKYQKRSHARTRILNNRFVGRGRKL